MKNRLSKLSQNRSSLVIITLIVLLFLAVIMPFLSKDKSTKIGNANLNDINTVKNLVGRLMVLPQDEEPALATVTDTTKLSSRFAGKVENEDKILFYQASNKAVIFRPNINKIVDVEIIQIDDLEKK